MEETAVCSQSKAMRTDSRERSHADNDLHVTSLTVVIKQEETRNSPIQLCSASRSALLSPDSQICASHSTLDVNTAMRLAHTTDTAILPFRVEEPASEDDDENWEQKASHAGDDPLGIQIKQEFTDEHTDSAVLPFRVKEEPTSDEEENWELKGNFTGDDPMDMEIKHTHTTVLPFQVKEEPAIEDKGNSEQKGSHTGDDLLGIQIKQEVTDEHIDSMEEEVNLKEEIEDSGSEIDEGNTGAFCDNSAVVKSENSVVPDTGISEEDSMCDAAQDMDKQKEECSGVGNRRQIFHKYMKKFCHATKAGYTCSLCGKTYGKSQSCLLHIWHMHTGDKPHACKLCGKSFKSVLELKNHRATHTDEHPYSCDICGKSFKQVGRLDRHKTFHSNERPFSCDVCGKTFEIRSDLHKHQVSHSNERSHSCGLCEKAFKTKAYLQQHIYSCHSDERPFSCDECGESFKRVVQLDRHKAFHTNERPYSCDLCEKDFTAKENLRQHKYLCHSDRRPYACDVCERAFKRKEQLLKHKQSCGSNANEGSNGQLYPCDECGSSFKRKISLQQHKGKLHKKKKPNSYNVGEMTFNQLNEQTKLGEVGNENAILSLDKRKIFFTYSKLTNLRIKQELME